MSGKIIRGVFLVSLAAALAGCNSSGPGGALSSLGLKSSKKTDTAEANSPTVVQGSCPQVVLREGTAFFTLYAKGAKKTPDGQADPEKLRYQATLSQATRQCRQTDTGMVVTVAAYGRLVAGPVGEAGTVTMPIRVAAVDGETTIYSEMTQFPVELPPGQGNTQFIFTKSDVVLPNGSGPLTKVFVGFDEGPYNTK